jgi:MoaA/NifB/PqqE/SkfB family radical SAM enzyme
MKQYYELMDKLIDNGKAEDVALHIYTNCSVYNPKFVEKIKKFKNVKLNFSIDAVGKVAEYQRKGTDWETVKSNAHKLAEIENVQPSIHSTITAYAILDIDSLIDFYIEMKEKFASMRFQMHLANNPLGMGPSCLDERLRKIAIEKIEKSLPKLNDDKKYGRVKKELISIRNNLQYSPLKHYEVFVRLTKNYDVMRDEKFKDIYGYDLT